MATALKRVAEVKRGVAEEWTVARISDLSVEEIKRLRDNATRLEEPALVERCEAALKESRSTARARGKSAADTKARRLVARVKAFEARGVFLQDTRTSWGGIRKSDGAVVFALWAAGIESVDGGCRYLLWAPNVDGSRPWSDKAPGRERLEHCRRALELGSAEGLLVYGQALGQHLPEEKAYAIHGVDAETVVTIRVAKRGDEFWAEWGKSARRPAAAR